MRKSVALASLLALGLGMQARADERFSYSLAEGGYAHGEIKDLNLNGDGFSLAGSVDLAPNFFGLANLVDLDYDGGLSTRQFSLGVGYYWPLAPDLDLISTLSYEDVRAHVSGVGTAGDSGYGVGIGLRGRTGDRLELTGNVKYVDVGNGNDDFTLSAGARYFITNAFAIGPDISHNNDGTAWGVSFRYDFGRRY